MRPFIFDRGAPEAESRRGFFDREPGEIAQPHDLGFSRINLRKAIQSAIQRDQINIGFLLRHFDGIERCARPAAASSVGAFGSCVIDQQPPHGLGRGAKEMGAPIPTPVIRGESNPDFMDKRGWLEGVPGAAGSLLGHQGACCPTQFTVERVDQLIGKRLECVPIARAVFLIGHAAIIEVFWRFPATEPLDSA